MKYVSTYICNDQILQNILYMCGQHVLLYLKVRFCSDNYILNALFPYLAGPSGRAV
jgi:hypothetical protein